MKRLAYTPALDCIIFEENGSDLLKHSSNTLQNMPGLSEIHHPNNSGSSPVVILRQPALRCQRLTTR